MIEVTHYNKSKSTHGHISEAVKEARFRLEPFRCRVSGESILNCVHDHGEVVVCKADGTPTDARSKVKDDRKDSWRHGD